jgi:hypothetical protein
MVERPGVMQKKTIIHLLADLIGTTANLYLMADAADHIAADARFNAWVGSTAKVTKTEDEMMALLDMYEPLQEELAAALATPVDVEALRSLLQRSTRRLEETMMK